MNNVSNFMEKTVAAQQGRVSGIALTIAMVIFLASALGSILLGVNGAGVWTFAYAALSMLASFYVLAALKVARLSELC